MSLADSEQYSYNITPSALYTSVSREGLVVYYTVPGGQVHALHAAVLGTDQPVQHMYYTWSWGNTLDRPQHRHLSAVVEWYGAGLAIARLQVRLPPVAAVNQRQLSVPSLRGRLMSTSGSWGVNGHIT